jgi:hypothetical protein
MSNQIKDTIKVDLHNQIISSLPIINPDELEDVLINAADKLTDGKEPVILEALMNTLVDFYVFTLEPGDDTEDIGFLVSTIEDKVCDAVAFRKTLIENGVYDAPEMDVRPLSVEDVQDINAKFGIEVPIGDEDDEDDDLPQPIQYEKFTETVDTSEGKKVFYKIRPAKDSDKPASEPPVSDPDDIRDKEIPGMMKRFESDGFEVTVKLVPKQEF